MNIYNAALKQGSLIKYGHYLDAYEMHFKPLRKSPLSILEIGVQLGDSLRMWKKYFPKGKVYGIDNDPSCKACEQIGIQIFIGDQADSNFLAQVLSKVGELDIVIDDGGHTMHQQQTSFMEIFPSLKEGGIYVIEDLHTSYWPDYGGGGSGTTIEMIKTFIDIINSWARYSKRAGKRQIKEGCVDHIKSTISSIHIYESISFIYKKKARSPIGVGS